MLRLEYSALSFTHHLKLALFLLAYPRDTVYFAFGAEAIRTGWVFSVSPSKCRAENTLCLLLLWHCCCWPNRKLKMNNQSVEFQSYESRGMGDNNDTECLSLEGNVSWAWLAPSLHAGIPRSLHSCCGGWLSWIRNTEEKGGLHA